MQEAPFPVIIGMAFEDASQRKLPEHAVVLSLIICYFNDDLVVSISDTMCAIRTMVSVMFEHEKHALLTTRCALMVCCQYAIHNARS